ncbi:MAG: cell division protein FtsQ/DivIB [Mycobacteriales bacterium]
MTSSRMTSSRPAAVPPEVPRLAARAKAQRRARRRRFARRGAQGLLVLLPLAALAWVLLASTWLSVDRVEVLGTVRLTVEQVTAAAGVAADTPLARVDLDRIEAAVGRLAPVAAVEAHRSWPGSVRLDVTERTPVAGFAGPDGVTLIDGSGVAFATEPTLPTGVVRLEVDDAGPADPATRAALEVYLELPPGLQEQVRTVRAGSASSVQLVLPDGREVVWGAPGDTATKAAATLALLGLPGTVFDVSAPGVVVRK